MSRKKFVFSVIADEMLVAKLEEEARKEHRSRSAMAEQILRERYQVVAGELETINADAD